MRARGTALLAARLLLLVALFVVGSAVFVWTQGYLGAVGRGDAGPCSVLDWWRLELGPKGPLEESRSQAWGMFREAA